MKSILLLIVCLSSIVFSECIDSSITVQKGPWKNNFLICDSIRPYKEIKTRLKLFDDSRSSYHGYMRAKFVGIGVVVAMSGVLVPASIKMSADGNAAGSFLMLTLMIPAFISTSIQKEQFNTALELYNGHYR